MRRVIVPLVFLLLTTSFAAAQTTVTGKVTDQDGKPMLKADVILVRPTNVQAAIRHVQAAKDGHFSMTIDSSGVWLLEFAGVDHAYRRVALYVHKPRQVRLNVMLKTYDYVPDFSNVKIVGSFNGWSRTSAVPMKKNSDGTYSATISSSSDSVAYRLLNVVEGDLVEGTQADYYLYDGFWGYNSVVKPVKGKVKIIFDPSKLERSTKPSRVVFADSGSFEAKFAAIFHEMRQNESAYAKVEREYMSSGKNPANIRYDWTKTTRQLKERIAREKNPILKHELQLYYITLGAFRAKLDSTTVREALREISPASRMWSMSPVISFALNFAHLSNSEQAGYVERVLAENPDVSVKTSLLASEIMLARARQDTAVERKYYDILVNNYGKTRMAQVIKAAVPLSQQEPRIGQPVPAFAVQSLGDPAETITNASLKGKYYMMDFWATWCGPCVSEMGNLQKTYREFKGKDFTILSLSLDQSREDVVKFREGKWKMPWMQAFLGYNSKNRIIKDFHVTAIPKWVFVDSTGKVLAVGVGAEGDQFGEAIAKFLAK